MCDACKEQNDGLQHFYLQAPRAKSRYYYVRGVIGPVKLTNGWSTQETNQCKANRKRLAFEAAARNGQYPDGVHFSQLGQLAALREKAAERELTLREAIETLCSIKKISLDSAAYKYIFKPLLAAHGDFVLGMVNEDGDVTSVAIRNRHLVQWAARFEKAATANRQIFTPVHSACKAVGIAIGDFKRPAGHDTYRHGEHLAAGEQLDRFLDECDKIEPKGFGLFVELLAYTGMRRGELANLLTRRIDLNREYAAGLRGVIVLPGLASDNRTKTGEGRVLPLTPRLRARLQAHLQGLAPDDRVFAFRPLGGSFLRRTMHVALAAAGIQRQHRHGGFHLLRHSYGTMMSALGVDLVKIGAWKSRAAASRYDHHVSKEAAAIVNVPSRPLLSSVA